MDGKYTDQKGPGRASSTPLQPCHFAHCTTVGFPETHRCRCARKTRSLSLTRHLLPENPKHHSMPLTSPRPRRPAVSRRRPCSAGIENRGRKFGFGITSSFTAANLDAGMENPTELQREVLVGQDLTSGWIMLDHHIRLVSCFIASYEKCHAIGMQVRRANDGLIQLLDRIILCVQQTPM